MHSVDKKIRLFMIKLMVRIVTAVVYTVKRERRVAVPCHVHMQ
jgi:hypothetical protein